MLRFLVPLQGVAGLTALTAGAYVVAGLGVALLVAGAFLMFGAWMSSR